MSKQSWLLRAATGGLVLQALPAFAQEENKNAPVDEIIVTARKRDESIMRVPVIETAIPQATLEKYNLNDLFTVVTRVPGVVISDSSSAIGIQVSIRGIGTTAFNPALDNSVSLNVDGLQLTQGLAYRSAMFDLGQIEILKGPQALFYGKNSPAGVISMRSADPTDKAEIILRSGYEYEAEEKLVEAIFSGPVSASLKLRLATQYSNEHGYFVNKVDPVLPGTGAQNPTFRNFPREELIVRGTALFNPSELYDARLKVNASRRDMKGGIPGSQLGYCPEGTPNNVGTIRFINPGDECKLDKDVRQPWMDPSAYPGNALGHMDRGGSEYNILDQDFGSLEQNAHFGDDLTLTSVTTLYSASQEDAFNTVGAEATSPAGGNTRFKNDQFTQELRLTSDFTDSPVNFMLGGFYQDGKIKNRVLTMGNARLGFPAIIQFAQHQVDIESISAFGQVLWRITPTLEAAAGARWTDEDRKHTEYNLATGVATLVPLAVPKIASSNVSPEFSLIYTPTDDLSVFGSYKQGYKSGSFNAAQFVAPGAHAEFDDEKVKGAEIGIKTRMFDRRVTMNLATYRYEYSDLQVGSIEITASGAPAIRTLNAASATARGVDFDVNYRPELVDGLQLFGAVNYNDSKYDSFKNAPCGNGQTIAQGCNQNPSPQTGRFTAQDLSGRGLVRAPKWQAYFGVDYEMSVASDMSLVFGAGANYTSKFYNNLIAQPGFIQDSYYKANATVALKGPDDKWEVSLVGNNLNDKVISGNCSNVNVVNGVFLGGQISGAATNGPAGLDEANCFPERGREVWLRFTLRPLDFLGR